MSSKAPKTLPAPDPRYVAAAQTGSNQATAQTNAILTNANERNPYGNIDYSISGYEEVYDPSTGNRTSIPRYTRTQTFSPTEQKLYDQQNDLAQGLNTAAKAQLGRVSDAMGRPLTLDSLPQSPLPEYGDLSLGNNDFSADRQRVEDALMSRLNPQLDRDRASLENTLVNQGFSRNTEAFDREMEKANQTATDARMQAILAGGQEQSRMTEIARARGLYEMGLRQQGYSDTQTARERGLQEQLALRNQPINEISALMSGGQVTMPQFTPYRAQPMSETPIGQYMYQSAQMNNQNAIAKAQAQQQQMSGLFGLAGNLAGAGAYWARGLR
jgi:hypothetical protein